MSRNVSIKLDELVAMMVLEELYKQPFHKSERPDLHNGDNTIGIEVTRAYDIEYEKNNGELRYSQANDISDRYAYMYDDSLREVIDRIANRIIDKMKKLVNYRRYLHEYLYMRTSLKISDYSFKLLSEEFDKMKRFVFDKCESDGSVPYMSYEYIIIEGADAILVWDWKNDDLFVKSDVLGEFDEAVYELCKKAEYLIDCEAEGKLDEAGEHTMRKNAGW